MGVDIIVKRLDTLNHKVAEHEKFNGQQSIINALQVATCSHHMGSTQDFVSRLAVVEQSTKEEGNSKTFLQGGRWAVARARRRRRTNFVSVQHRPYPPECLARKRELTLSLSLLYLRLAAGLLLLGQSLPATVISGSIVNVTGQPMSSNRSITFTLENCGSNIPLVQGSAIVVPGTVTLKPNPAGMLAGTIVGNDIVSCGGLIGQTYYQVTVFAGSLQIYQQNFIIAGPSWNIATAIPISSDPAALTNYMNGQAVTYKIGDLIVGAGNNYLGLVSSNTTTTINFLCQVGTGTQASTPSWCTPSQIAADIPPSTTLPALSGDISNSSGVSTALSVTQVGGTAASSIASAVASFDNYGMTTPGTNGMLKYTGSRTPVIATPGAAGDYYAPGYTINATDLPTSGATPSTYGSSALIPVISVDVHGRITSISTVATAVNPWSLGTGSSLYYTGGHVLVGTSTVDGSDTLQVSGNIKAGGYFTGPGTDITGLTASSLTAGDFSAKINGPGTYPISISGNAGTVTNGIYSSGSYSNPTWLSLTKAAVGLSNVENTALSTWAGTTNVTTVAI